MKIKILCLLLTVIFIFAVFLAACEKSPETTSDRKTTAATTALTTAATTASTTTSEKSTTTTVTTASTTVQTFSSEKTNSTNHTASVSKNEFGWIVQTVADKDPISVLSSFFEIDLPKDAKVLEYRHETEYVEGSDTKTHIYTARLCVAQEQLQQIQNRLEERYYSFIKDAESTENSPAKENGAHQFNMKGENYLYPWQIHTTDILDFCHTYRPVEIQVSNQIYSTDEQMYILITKEDGQYYLYFDGTGCTAKE